MNTEESRFQIKYRLDGLGEKGNQIIDISSNVNADSFNILLDYIKSNPFTRDLCFIDKEKDEEVKIISNKDFKYVKSCYLEYITGNQGKDKIMEINDKCMSYAEIKDMATNTLGTKKMKSYNFDLNINGKITIEVMAENKEQAKQMVNDLLENSSFKRVLESSKNKVSLDMKLKEKEMAR